MVEQEPQACPAAPRRTPEEPHTAAPYAAAQELADQEEWELEVQVDQEELAYWEAEERQE